MNRTQYRQARRLIRDNGAYALRWLAPAQANVWRVLLAQRDDRLAEEEFFFRAMNGSPAVKLAGRYARA